MALKPKVCVVIPTYNERENIETIIERILRVTAEAGLNLEILVVDDNSPDGTGELVEELSKQDSRIHLLRRSGKLGLGSAYRDGFRKAVEEFGAEILVEMDADGSHDPTHLPAMIDRIIGGCDIVVGSRYIQGGEIIGWGLKRKIISSGANFLSRKLCGIKIRDATSGYRAIKASTLKKLNLDEVSASGYVFQVAFLFRAQNAGLKICEVPIVFRDRVRARSKLGLREMVNFFWTCLKLAFSKG